MNSQSTRVGVRGKTAIYGWRGQVGILVPPANTTVEPEMAATLPDGVTVHTSRLPGRVAEDTSIGMRERFLGYNQSLRATADSFGGMPLDALCLACTGSSYLVGPDGEGGLLADLAAGGAAHVNTAAGTIREVFAVLGCRRIAVVSPYPPWLTELAVQYWRASGFEVADCVEVSQVVSIYAIQASQALDAARRLDLSQVDGIVLSGTGMPTLHAIEQLASEIHVPVVSSNLCTAWWFISTLDREAALQSPSPALRQLASWLGT